MPDPFAIDPRDDSPQLSEPDFSPKPVISSPPKPRPGILLALLIVAGILVFHILVTLTYGRLFHWDVIVLSQQHESPQDFILSQLKPRELLRMMMCVQGLFCITALGVCWWAYRKRLFEVIPFRIPSIKHLGLIALLVLPLMVMDGFLATQMMEFWESLFGAPPSHGDLPELLKGIVSSSSTAELLFLVAVLPAVGEELVFRGIIGRGLLARYGFVGGLLLTSLMFSVVHGNAPQAAGVFFVGVMCHVSYLATRSILAPMFLHFLNNTLPILMLKALSEQPEGGPLPATEQLENATLPVGIALVAAMCVAAIGGLLWKTRVEYVDSHGNPIPEDQPQIEQPPGGFQLQPRTAEGNWALYACLAYLLFFGSLVYSANA